MGLERSMIDSLRLQPVAVSLVGDGTSAYLTSNNPEWLPQSSSFPILAMAVLGRNGKERNEVGAERVFPPALVRPNIRPNTAPRGRISSVIPRGRKGLYNVRTRDWYSQ